MKPISTKRSHCHVVSVSNPLKSDGNFHQRAADAGASRERPARGPQIAFKAFIQWPHGSHEQQRRKNSEDRKNKLFEYVIPLTESTS